MRYRIRNWKKFQHYKDRNPPWIKLYARELNHDREWMGMTFATRGLWCMLLCLASEKDGEIPNPRQLKARLESETDIEHPLPDYSPLMGRWIEDVPGAEVEPKSTPAPAVSAAPPDRRPGVPPCPECGSTLTRQQARKVGNSTLPPGWWCPGHRGAMALDDPRIYSRLAFAAQQTVQSELAAFRQVLADRPAAKRKSGRFDQGLEHIDAPDPWSPPAAPKDSLAGLALADFLKAIQGRPEISAHSFTTWFSVLIPVRLTDDNTALTVAWPSEKGQEWFAANYLKTCQTVAASLGITRFELWSPTTQERNPVNA